MIAPMYIRYCRGLKIRRNFTRIQKCRIIQIFSPAFSRLRCVKKRGSELMRFCRNLQEAVFQLFFIFRLRLVAHYFMQRICWWNNELITFSVLRLVFFAIWFHLVSVFEFWMVVVTIDEWGDSNADGRLFPMFERFRFPINRFNTFSW